MANLLALLDSADLPDDVRASLRELLPAPLPALDVIVDRLSLPRTFTARMFAAAIGDLAEAPAFNAFVASAHVTPIAGYPGRYAIADATRSERLAAWSSRRDDGAFWARTLLPLLDASDPVERLDGLQLAFLGDQAEARRDLRQAFDAADAHDDIPECTALVQVVAPIIRLFGDGESTALLNEIRSRSQSRNLYLAEFYQTAQYHPRAIEQDLRRFVSGTGDRWIFHVHATGGMGKTTLLRRLISHEWVVGRGHLPCAWIDFDYLDVATVLQHPALLGLAMAAQWNEQLEQPVFGAFLTPSFQPLGSLLFRTRADASARGLDSASVDRGARARYRAGLSNPMRCGFLSGAVPPRTVEERTQRLALTTVLLSYWADRLPDCIASMPADRPVVLVLDTLEDASLHHGQQLLDTLRLLAALRRQAHQVAERRGHAPAQLKLLLSGRHRLGEEHVREFAREFEGQYEAHALPGFADAEARAFLVGHVGPAHADHGALLDAIVDKSEGIPFNLSLFAEWASDAPDLDAATVTASEDVSTAMLIERIVKRITHQPLRWIIRYGVVPRTLSLEYLRDVMQAPLVEALSGRAGQAGLDLPRSAAEQDVWKPEPGFVFDADALWAQHVVPYSGQRSWLSPGEHPDEVAFRSDIRQPMRRLLRSQRVFEDLHTRSRDWFRARAMEATGWSTDSLEWLYHELQLRTIPGRPSVDLLPTLRTLLDDASLRQSHDLRVVVCQSLRTADFDDFTPREQAYIQYRLAEALGALHDYSYVHPEAVRALQLVFDLDGALAPDTLPRFATEWRRAVQGTNVAVLLQALHAMPPDDRLRLSLLFCDLAERHSRIAADMLGSALAAAQEARDPAIPVSVLAERLARNLEPSDPDAAARHLATAAEDCAAHGHTERAAEMLRRASALHLSLGRIHRAEEVLAPTTTGHAQPPGIRLQLARIELAKGNPGNALPLLAVDDQLSGPGLGELWRLRAEALSQRMRVREAMDAWEQASSVATQHGDSRALADIAVGQACFYHWRLRTTLASTPGAVQSLLQQLSHAEGAVEGAGRASARQSPPGEVDVWQIAFGPPQPDHWQRRAFRELEGESPAARVRLILALSQVVQPFPQQRWDELVEQARLLPGSARVAALQPPVLRGARPELPAPLRAVIAETFHCDPEGEIEAAWYALRRGELLGWLGSFEEAMALLSRVPTMTTSAHRQAWNAATYRERRRIEERIRAWAREDGARVSLPPPIADPPELWANFWRHTPFRAAAALIENAQRAHDAGQRDVAEASLALALPELERMPLETEFHVVARELRAALDGAARPRASGRSGRRRGFASMSTGSVSPRPVHGRATEGGSARSGAARGAAGVRQEGLESIAGAAATAAGVESVVTASPEARLGGAPFTVLELRERHGRLACRVDMPERERVLSPECRTLETLLRSRRIPRRLTGVPLLEIVQDLREVMKDTGLAPEASRSAIRVPLSSLTCAPWEAAFEGAQAPFRLPSTWNERDVEAQARLALAMGQTDVAVPLDAVLVLPLSPLDRESPAINGYLSLRSRFTRRLGETESLEAGSAASAIHIAACLIEIGTLNEPAIAGLEWTASTLAHHIARARGAYKPAVVLDVPLPATPSDLVHQLLLRNYFAQALVDSGAVSAVLATGLRPEPALDALHQVVVPALSSPGTPRIHLFDRVAADARAGGSPPLDALFTAHPYLPLIAATRPHA